MNLDDLKKPLSVENIDFRVGAVGGSKNKPWATILAYKDARVDIKRLNDVCGIDGWQRKNELIDGQLFCSVGVYSERIKDWVWKQDVGTESYTEKEKGRASDAFKRACFNFGIGIELYELPVLFCWLNEGEFFEKDGKIKASSKLKPNSWNWSINRNGDKITSVIAQDRNGVERVKGYNK